MQTNEKSPATRCNGDQAVENLGRDLDTDHATPHRLMLSPTSGNDWWNWCLSINGRPALTFNHLYHAAQTMRDIHDDLLDGFAHWAGEFDHITTEYLDLAAQGSVRGNWRKAGADHRVSIGWS